MKLFLFFAAAANAASPDSLATIDTANQNLLSTKGNFQRITIKTRERAKFGYLRVGFENFIKVEPNAFHANQQARQLPRRIPTAMMKELLLNVLAVKMSATLKL